jgi:hypothetical protein
MKQRLILFASLLGLITGCASPAQSPIPTPYPPEYLPTVVALTAQAIAQAASDSMTATYVASIPTETPVPVASPTLTPEPTFSPTPFPTNTPTAIPGHNLAAIQMVVPGPMSKVVSPINMQMYVIAGDSKRVEIALYGEDGRLLARTLRREVPTSTKGIFLTSKLTFEIRAAAEIGRISVTTFDKEGRIQSVGSTRVLLLSTGVNEINPAGNLSEPVGVMEPVVQESVYGGVVTVSGDIWPFSLQPVVFELVDVEGKSLGVRILTVDTINPQKFSTTIPYKVSEETSARLVIRQDDDRMPGLFYLYSQVVLLNP